MISNTHGNQVSLLTFANKPFVRSQKALCRSALSAGVDRTICWNRERLKKTRFYRDNKAVLDLERGAGYWLWKPYLIDRELAKLEDGAFLLYYDVGPPGFPHVIRNPLTPLLNWCLEHNQGIMLGAYIPEWGPNQNWCKRDCFVAMDCDQAYYWEHPQIMATYSLWQKNPNSTAFVKEWLNWCQVPGLITDEANRLGQSNLPGFIEHRHDQAILTNLALKRGVKGYGDPWTVTPRCKDLNSLLARIEGRQKALTWDGLHWNLRYAKWHCMQRVKQRIEKMLPGKQSSIHLGADSSG